MKWIKNLLGNRNDELHTGTSDLHNRIVEIKARIAAIRRSHGWDEEPYQSIKTQSDLVVAEEKQELKKPSSDDIKAKLLAIKK